jgi:flagellar basal-body rod protein FlgB
MSNITKDSTYNLIKSALSATTLRQNVISNNIANVNTADFKASNVDFEETLKNTLNGDNLSMKTTNSKHIGINGTDIEPEIVKEEGTKIKSDGNNVDVEKEMVNMAANQILYNALVQQASKKLSSMSYVISGGK